MSSFKSLFNLLCCPDAHFLIDVINYYKSCHLFSCCLFFRERCVHNLLQQMKVIREKTHITQTWEASSFFLMMVPSAFGKPVSNTFS